VAVRRRPARGARGQHFLRSKRLAADLVADAELARGDLVLEIGGGTGVLTEALAQAGARVLVLERDPALVTQLHGRFGRRPGITVVQADASEHDWPDEPFAVVANLPFARSGAILARLLRDPHLPLRKAHVIVQRLAPALGFAREARAWQLDAEQWARLFAFARGLENG